MTKHTVIVRIFAFALVAAAVLSLIFYPKEKAVRKEAEKRVIRVWNVDTFEGGRGSRTSFLKKIAAQMEKEKNIYFLIESYTKEGVITAFSEGNYPDMLSFGVGISVGVERALPLEDNFVGGSVEGKTLALPWCRGAYALFSRGGFEKEGKTAISCGGSNLPQVAAALSQIDGEELPSLSAYTAFLSGAYDYLLGTQRDYCRFLSRGVAVEVKPLPEFCDLYQYVSVFSVEKRAECLSFVQLLLSEETQSRLNTIGMYPVDVGQDNLSSEKIHTTLNVFSSQEALQEMQNCARDKEKHKNIVNFLKSI